MKEKEKTRSESLDEDMTRFVKCLHRYQLRSLDRLLQ